MDSITIHEMLPVEIRASLRQDWRQWGLQRPYGAHIVCDPSFPVFHAGLFPLAFCIVEATSSPQDAGLSVSECYYFVISPLANVVST